MKQPKKPNRCKKCKRIISSKNKRGYCCGCGANEMNKQKKKKQCYICEERCCVEMLIEWRKGQRIYVCTFHFNWLMAPKFLPMKELRKEIKRLKGCH